MITAFDVRDAFRYLYPDELPQLYKLAQMLDNHPTIVNIGAGSGTSGLAFLESRDDLVLHTVDIQEENSPLGCLYAERDVVSRAGLAHLWGVRWFQHHGDSKAIGRKWRTALDMVFVDGDHSYEGCKGDIEAWWPHIVPGGIMAIHDYAKDLIVENPNGPHPRPWKGVDEAVDELLRGKFEQLVYVDSLIAFRKPMA